MSSAGEAEALLEQLRYRVLRKLLTLYAAGAVTTCALFVTQALLAGRASTRLYVLVAIGQLVLPLRLLHARLGYRRTAQLFLLYLWLLPAALQFLRGLTPGTALSHVTLLLLGGLFFGKRGALYAFALSLLTLVVGGGVVALRLAPAGEPELWDPLHPLVWVRYALVFVFFGGALAVALTDVIGTLFEGARRLQDTLQREREERARREAAQVGLERAQRLEALAQLAGGMAHDFNNSLTVILSGLELIHMDTQNPPATRKLAEEVASTAEQASHGVRQLLALGRREPGRPERVRATDVLQSCAPAITRLLPPRVRLELRAATRAEVRMDVARLTQAVMNLALNARDAMAEQGLLTIAADECEVKDVPAGWLALPGRFVRLTWTDTGCGMDAETQRRIFEPFFTTKPQGKGTGLGLAMVHATVHEAGGFIEVESRPGVGSQFRVFLPMLQRAATPQELAQAAGS